MSRIGKQLVIIPSGVIATLENNSISIKGPKGELNFTISPDIKVTINEKDIAIRRIGNDRIQKSLHGMTRSLIQNMVIGVSKGFTKRLEVNGVGYRFQIQGKKLVLALGYSHPIEYNPPEEIEIKADEEKKNIIVITGIDKQKVGQVAAEIRSFRKPEPYKGKGIKYEAETLRRKAGKTAAKSSS
ncbi:MAG: 50S ribosomal protein L6, large subunit ribosomal protein L6 [Candidatus Peregrinibacteria bacterium GW2011_GWE2_39_6]|nr:MAG: 50S ribosomal protein L6, large subunit ribosomal protein L6 [Candidatus Peregrinibacteria bacterium GW2011_GWF2_39_17]KKR26548.1 MAG: 50S ribosomal protein L6, large subunit ribosomal protein L6 [Candidatus Peregrinibacteria bacterium GW2011_GWE2_39_6]